MEWNADPVICSENCRAKTLSVLGEHRIAFFASRPIKQGTEILMDYGLQYEKKHNLHGDGKKARSENPEKWTLGNNEGQIAIILDDSEERLHARSASEESTLRSSKRPRLLRRAQVPESDASDDSENQPLSRKCQATTLRLTIQC